MQNDETKPKCMNDLHQGLIYKLRPYDKIKKWSMHDNKPKLKMHEWFLH